MSKGKLEQFKVNLRSILIANGTEGVKLRHLNREYDEFHNERINHKDFGYHTLFDLLKACPDACWLRPDPEVFSEYIVIGVADESTAHVLDLVIKASKSKKRNSNRGSRSFRGNRGGFAPPRRHFGTEENRYDGGSDFRAGSRSATRTNFRTTSRSVGRNNFMSGPAHAMSSSRSTVRTDSRRFENDGPKPVKNAVARPTPDKTTMGPKPNAAKAFDERKKPKTTTAEPIVYCNYVASILKKRSFGMYVKELEIQYEQKFRESLPSDWVKQLDNVCLEIVNDFGDGIIQIRHLEQTPIPEEHDPVKSSFIPKKPSKCPQTPIPEEHDPVKSSVIPKKPSKCPTENCVASKSASIPEQQDIPKACNKVPERPVAVSKASVIPEKPDISEAALPTKGATANPRPAVAPEDFCEYRSIQDIMDSDEDNSDLEAENPCICHRQATVVFCLDCGYHGVFGRVRQICPQHQHVFGGNDQKTCQRCSSDKIQELEECK